jgi:precorrin-6B methylase 2
LLYTHLMAFGRRDREEDRQVPEKTSYGFEGSGQSTAILSALFLSFAFFRDLPEPWSLLLVPFTVYVGVVSICMVIGMTDWYRNGLDARIIDVLQMGRGSRPLNIVCGTGSLAVAFAKFIRKGEVRACDQWTPAKRNPDPARRTRDNVRIEGVDDIVLMDSIDPPTLPYKASTFNVAGSRYGITNTRKGKKHLVHETLRVLKSGGRLALAEGLVMALWLKYRVLRPLEHDFKVSDIQLNRYHFTWIVSAQKLG